MWLLVPAAATVIALAVLCVCMRRLAQEVVLLRVALRRSAAVGVASHELLREVTGVADHAEVTRASLRRLRVRDRPGSRREMVSGPDGSAARA